MSVKKRRFNSINSLIKITLNLIIRLKSIPFNSFNNLLVPIEQKILRGEKSESQKTLQSSTKVNLKVAILPILKLMGWPRFK